MKQKLTQTINCTAVIKQGHDEIIGRVWKMGPSVMLNPSFIVQQVPFTWHNPDTKESISGLEITTSLGKVWYTVGGGYL